MTDEHTRRGEVPETEPAWAATTPGSVRARAEGGGGTDARPGGSAPEGTAARRPRILVVLAVALAVTIPLAGLFAYLWQASDGDGGDVDDVRRTSGLFAERFLTVDSDDIASTRQGVLELSTGAFRRNYEEALETGVFEAILSLGRTRTETTIDEIFVGDTDGRASHAIVQAEVVSRTLDADGNERPPRVLELFLELDLVKQSEGWLIDNVRNLNFGGGATTPPSGESGETGGG